MNPTNSVVIPQSLVLRFIVLGWILIYRNWSIEDYDFPEELNLNVLQITGCEYSAEISIFILKTEIWELTTAACNQEVERYGSEGKFKAWKIEREVNEYT